MIVGIDIGYGYTKAVGRDRQVVFPSVVGKAERVRYESDLRQLGASGDGGAEIALITEEGDHFIGELAMLQSRVQWTLLDRSRVEDPSARLLFLAALTEMAGNWPPPQPSPVKPTGEGEEAAPARGCAPSSSPPYRPPTSLSASVGVVRGGLRGGQGGGPSFQVVTGLPVNWYADRDKVVEQLSGTHVVRRVNGRQADGPHPPVHRFAVEEVLVVPQPFGSLFDAILGSDGQIVDEGLAQGRLGVIDVGTYTTDYVLVDRLRYIERGSGTLSTAMSRAYQLVGRSILDTYGLELRMHQVDRAVREGQVTVFGEERRVDWLADPVLDALAQEVLAEAGTLWGDGRDLKAILVTGGGAMALGERIRRRYAHARVLPDAALANVKGFFKYGQRKWREREP
jgi:plasmid segregation protein ParM